MFPAKLLLIFVCGVTFSAGLSTATNISVNPKKAIKNVGEDLEVLCTVTPTTAIEHCLINIGHKDYVPVEGGDGNIAYHGAGFGKGECGATIRNVSREYDGQIICKILLKDNSHVYSEAAMTLIVTTEPEPPALSSAPAGPLTEGALVRTSCEVRGGAPPADVSLSLGGESFDGNVTTVTEPTNNTTTVMTVATWRPTADDDQKIVVCSASHHSWGDLKRVNKTITVLYKPKIYNLKDEIQKEDIVFSGLELERAAILILKVKSNPKPTNIGWVIGNKTIYVGTTEGRYETIEKQENGFFIYSLTIANLTKEDVDQKYLLEVNNTVGSSIVDFRLEAKTIKGKEEEPIKPKSMAGGTTIGIISAVLLLFLVIAVFMFAKINKKFCFASKEPPTYTGHVVANE